MEAGGARGDQYYRVPITSVTEQPLAKIEFQEGDARESASALDRTTASLCCCELDSDVYYMATSVYGKCIVNIFAFSLTSYVRDCVHIYLLMRRTSIS